MKTFLIKKITLGILFMSILATSIGFIAPKQTDAAAAIVNDPIHTVQGTITAANTLTSAYSNMSLQLKAFVLDTLATTLVKQLIRRITADVVNWINSGFEGSPAFVTNPGGFLIDVADQVTGAFLAKAGGPLTALCSPFSIDIRLALSFKYHPNVPKRYECTLGKIITNSKNAIQGATINGFAAGDFRQGGWPAFVSMTTEPQNNVYGAYLQADSELSVRVANMQIGKKEEINNGKGFLSWRNTKCSAEVKAHNATVAKNFETLENATGGNAAYQSERIRNETITQNFLDLENSTGAEFTAASKRIGGDTTQMNLRSKEDCPIETPGSLIVSNLEASVNGPLHELELVDSINEIVNALAAALVNKVLQAGLASVSGSGPSDSTAYLNQIQAEANGVQASSVKSDLLKNLQTYTDYTVQYKTNKDNSLKTVLDVKARYEAVSACYSAKIAANPQVLTPAQVSDAQSRLVETNAFASSTVGPLVAPLLSSVANAESRYQTLTALRDKVTAAVTVNDLNEPSTKYAELLQSQSLTSPKDIADSQTELDSIREQTAPMIQDANRRSLECQAFPYGSTQRYQ